MSKEELTEQEAMWELLETTFPGKDHNLVINLPNELAELEKNKLMQVLEFHDWNKSRAAKDLGIGRTNLIAKIKKYELIQD
jgi:transcriptional regulator with PAS, ATPase and Fis domain